MRRREIFRRKNQTRLEEEVCRVRNKAMSKITPSYPACAISRKRAGLRRKMMSWFWTSLVGRTCRTSKKGVKWGLYTGVELGRRCEQDTHTAALHLFMKIGTLWVRSSRGSVRRNAGKADQVPDSDNN